MEAKNKSKTTNESTIKPFGEHLEDLRWTIIKSIVAIIISTIICFVFSDSIFKVFYWPLTQIKVYLDGKVENLVILKALHPAEAFLMSLKLSLIAGIILSSPLVFYFIWEFVAPGLQSKEKKLAIPAILIGSGCFAIGILFCYFIILKLCLLFFWKYTTSMNVEPNWTIENYISFVGKMLIAFGITFELPVFTAVLTKLGIINSKTLQGKRSYSLLAIFIVAAILTPPDVLSQILLAAPMIGLYEISILISKLIEKGEKR